jgi:protein-disulfide isomerase
MSEEIKIKKSSMKNSAIIILLVLLIISLFTGGFGISSNANVVKIDEPTNNPPSINMEQLIDDDSIKGDKDAPVTIVEFSDYECPFCERFYSQTYNLIESEYIDTGKVKLIFRDFPLSFHANAQKAAEAAECAGEQGKYYEMHDKLFEEGVSNGIDSFKQYAKEIGLNEDEFNTCLDTGAMASEVKEDMSDGQKAGVQGTPAFFINGELVSGAQPFSVFQEKIEAALN